MLLAVLPLSQQLICHVACQLAAFIAYGSNPGLPGMLHFRIDDCTQHCFCSFHVLDLSNSHFHAIGIIPIVVICWVSVISMGSIAYS